MQHLHHGLDVASAGEPTSQRYVYLSLVLLLCFFCFLLLLIIMLLECVLRGGSLTIVSVCVCVCVALRSICVVF